MPECDSDQELSDKFADYFMQKIENILGSLKETPEYVTTK